MADIATAALVFGGFLVVFCAFGAISERIIEHRRSRRLRRRIGRYGA